MRILHLWMQLMKCCDCKYLLLQVLAVCEALQTDVNFETLDLTNNFLNDLAAQAIASLIKVRQ